MSNEKSFLFHNTVYYVAVFLIVVTASGVSLPYWNWFKLTSDYNGTATATQLLGGISFQIDNMTFSHHLASFNGIQMQNAESLPHLKMMQAIELLGTRVAPALRKELGGDK
jgi:hypothetical protein